MRLLPMKCRIYNSINLVRGMRADYMDTSVSKHPQKYFCEFLALIETEMIGYSFKIKKKRKLKTGKNSSFVVLQPRTLLLHTNTLRHYNARKCKGCEEAVTENLGQSNIPFHVTCNQWYTELKSN